MSKTNTASQTLNREGWLTAFAVEIAPLIKQRTGLSVPLSKTRLSCSFPRTRATPNKNGGYTIGQCFHADGHKSGLHEVMINPLRDKVIETVQTKEGPEGHGIAETIIHELIHASLPMGVGHKAPFARAAKQMGLQGKPTATNAGPELVERIKEIADKLGPYPHRAIEGEWGRKQTTRLLKVMCTDCGYINEAGNGYTARITLTWIENAGLPTCPCGATMSLIEKGEEVQMVALKPVESSAVYRIPSEDGEGFDDRFQVRRTSSEHFGDRWAVIDLGERIVDGVYQFESTARIVAAEDKQNALDMIDAIREGLYTWDDLEGDTEDVDVDLGEVPEDDYADEFRKGLFHDVDEDEDPDYPEDATPEGDVLRMRRNGEWVEKAITFDYAEESDRRDAAGARKSESIASGAEAAMD